MHSIWCVHVKWDDSRGYVKQLNCVIFAYRLTICLLNGKTNNYRQRHKIFKVDSWCLRWCCYRFYQVCFVNVPALLFSVVTLLLVFMYHLTKWHRYTRQINSEQRNLCSGCDSFPRVHFGIRRCPDIECFVLMSIVTPSSLT